MMFTTSDIGLNVVVCMYNKKQWLRFKKTFGTEQDCTRGSCFGRAKGPVSGEAGGELLQKEGPWQAPTPACWGSAAA